MGLPIFITPTEPDMASKAAEKIASVPRSSIRRQRAVRRSHPPVSVETIRRRMQGMAADSNTAYEIWENTERERRPSPRDAEEPSAASQGRGSRALDDERMRLRETLSFERQHLPNVEIDGPLMPPVPEPRDYSSADVRRREIQRLLEVRRDLRRIARRRPAPTPPYTDTDLALMARMGTESPRPASVTPARSPRPTLGELETSVTFSGRPASGDLSFTAREPPGPARSPSHRLTFQETESPANLETTASDGFGSTTREAPDAAVQQARSVLSERFRALNRVSSHFERSRRVIRQPRLDGLGDRDRSLSPDGGAAWDTLLTSIAPDPQPPSAGSSFASTTAAAAAASSSTNSGPASASTPMTSFGRTEDSPTLHDCDVSDSASNSEEEEDSMYMFEDIARMRGNPRNWRVSWAEMAAARADRVAQISSTEDTEHLGGMQRIISRLAERDDIPEEWWRMAGLRREPTN